MELPFPLKNNLENLAFTTDLYKCGSCSVEFDLLEDMMIHKINDENCGLVFLASHKLEGIQIPRFIQGILNSDGNDGISTEHTLAVETKSKSDTHISNSHEHVALHQRHENLEVEENLDCSLNFSQISLPGAKYKLRSTCDICGNSYRDATILKTHLQTVHSNNKPFCCDFEDCTFACKTKASLERHIRRHTGERPFICESCGRSFRESGTLARHIRSRVPCTRKAEEKSHNYNVEESPKKKLAQLVSKTPPKAMQILLPEQDNNFSVKSLALHGNKSTEIILECNDNSLDTLKKDASHSLIQLLESAAKEAVEGTEFQETNNVALTAGPEALLSPYKIKDEIARQMLESSLLCLVCKQNFKSANELSQHLQLHLEDHKFRCDKCYYVDSSHVGLENHLRTHHIRQQEKSVVTWPEVAATQLISLHDFMEEQMDQDKAGKYYRCHVCLKKFSQKAYFKMHMNSHTGGAVFECDECKRTFINKDSLQKHLITHSLERAHRCEICSKLFKRQNHLKDHLRTHSDSKPYVCKICNRSFKWQCVLKVHETSHLKESLFCCETCGRQLRNKSSLTRHTKRHSLPNKSASSVDRDSFPTARCFNKPPSAAETSKAAADLAAAEVLSETQNPHTYLLVLDENSLVLEDGSCILENAIVHTEDI